MSYKGSDKQKETSRRWRLENRARVALHAKRSNAKCQERVIAYNKLYREKNKAKLSEYYREWTKKNHFQIRDYVNTKRKTDIQFRLREVLRTRQTKALGGDYKSGSFVRDLGCTIAELRFYIEGKFLDGMSWDNYGHDSWHIDHAMPLAFFDLTDREQFLKACHYTNLQPLWATENLKKGRKITKVSLQNV